MIVDSKGNVFEDRRKANSDRRKRKTEASVERRKADRRKPSSKENRADKNK